MVLDAGDPAPDVSARNQDDELVDPSVDEPTVVYFYPRDDTRGCTIEAEQFREEHPSYRDAGVAVHGVSTDGVDSHAAFHDDLELQFDLLADPEGEVADAFGVPVEDGAAARTTVVLHDGVVHRVYENVDYDGHARTVLVDLLDDGIVQLPE